MKTLFRSSIPFVLIFLIVIACGNTKNKDSSSVKKEETVNSYKEKGNTKTDNVEEIEKETPKKKKKKQSNENSLTEKKESPKLETNKPRYRVGARCCDGTRSYSTGRGTCSRHGGVCEWLYSN